MARIKNELGQLDTSRRQVAEARQSHLAALALLEADATLPSAPATLRFELARTYFFLGIQERPLPAADPRQAVRPAQTRDAQRGTLAKAVELLRELPSSPPANPEYQHLLALGYSRLEVARRRAGEQDKADEAARKAEQERGAIPSGTDRLGF